MKAGNSKKLRLRTYQTEDAKKLIQYDGTACFNEQRTGKTPTALQTVKLRKIQNKRILIVTTASSQYQWKDEYERWLKKPCIICSGTPKQKDKAIESWKNGLVISIDSFKETARSEGLVGPILSKKPVMIILDEAHKIKNPKSANAKALFKAARKIPYRLALTGTPAPGKPFDIFSILKFIQPDKYTSFWKFIQEYFIIEEKIIYVKGVRRRIMLHDNVKPEKVEQLQDILKKYSTQRKRKEVMKWLPDKFYVQIRLDATKQQKKYLDDLEKTFKVQDIETTGVLDRLIRTRQICLDPGLLDLKGKSPKTDWIVQYIKDNPEEQIIIFSKFTQYLNRLAPVLTKNKIKWAMLVGKTPLKTRNTFVKDFQKRKFQVFLINIDAGKEALTLDACETIIFSDKYPPIGDILQAEDRFISTTKDKADKNHKIVELMIKDTFDEKMYELLLQRKSETDIINNYKEYIEHG